MLPGMWSTLEQSVETWRNQISPHSLLTLPQWLAVFTDQFDQLLDFVAAADGEDRPVERHELALATAVVGLQLGNRPMAEPLWSALRHLAQTQLPAYEPRFCLELTIAFGCGWERPVQPGNDSWDGHWLSAILALRILVERSIHHTVQLVTQRLANKKTTSLAHSPDWQRSCADLIALELMHSRCSCGKHQRGCKARNGRWDCDQDCCWPAHQLSSWQPNVCSLQAFAAQAIRGSARGNLQTGMFTNGVLYTRLTEEFGVLVGTVEFKVCAKCSQPHVQKAIAEHQEPKGKGLIMFQGNSCPHCGQPADPETTYHKARKNWLLIPYDKGGRYQWIQRWRCRQDRNLYSVNRSACPLCSTAVPQRRTRVWVYFSQQQVADHFPGDEMTGT